MRSTRTRVPRPRFAGRWDGPVDLDARTHVETSTKRPECRLLFHTMKRAIERPRATPAAATGAHAVGAVALGAIALGALAIGALAIGRLAIGRARIRRLHIDELVVRRLRVIEQIAIPPGSGAESED